MLNRLFIAIGVLVILTLITAFLVPRFINWSDYRPRLEAMAGGAFGTKVSIEGDIALTLLPQPQLRFTKVRMGPPDAPVVEIEDVEASFSLLDFLRDAYSVTQLTIDHPVVNIAIGADGAVNSGLAIAEAAGQPNVTVPRAEVVGGSIHVVDARAGKTYAADNIDGTLTLEAIRGPFSFEGQGTVSGSTYAVHVGLGRLDATGGPTLGLLVQSALDRSTLQTDGTLQPGPHYVGQFKYRRSPPAGKKGEQVDAGRGDFTLEGKLDAATDRVLLSDYTALPDENRPTTRLTGAAELKLGAIPTFNAVISGGVVTLPPHDATKELADPPYEIVRLLSEIPLPPVPPLAGTVGLDVSEINLRVVSLRNLRLDAATDGTGWTIKSLTASLPGTTTLTLAGTLEAAAGKPVFAGQVSLNAQQLDRLSALWRKPSPGDPLLDTPGSLTADIALSGDRLELSAGKLVIGDTSQPFDAEIGLGPQRSLKLDANWSSVSPDESTDLAALLPDVISNGSFGATFPSGEIHFSADKATVFGIDGSGLLADVTWDGGVFEFNKLAAEDLGGMTFDANATAFGTLAKPELSGQAAVKVVQNSVALTRVLNAINVPRPVADYLARSLPADVTIKLDAPSGTGAQALAVTGTLNGVDAKVSATLTSGLVNALKAPITASLDMTTPTPVSLLAQLGFENVTLFDSKTPLHLTASVEGVPSNSYETHFRLDNGTDHAAFVGNVVPGDFTSITGSGDVDVAFSDPTAMQEILGAGGIYLPPIVGKAKLQFTNADNLKLSDIDAGGLSGTLALTRSTGRATITGALAAPRLDAKALLPYIVGPSGTLASTGPWPDGPIDLGDATRTSEGRIEIKAPAMDIGLATPLTDVTFGFDWDAQSVHLRDLSGKFVGAPVGLDATLCCAGTAIPAKQVNARVSIDGLSLETLAPAPVAMGLKGKLQASAEVSGTGATIAEAVAASNGSGSYSITDFSAPNLNPGLFAALGGLSDIVDMEPDVLTATVEDKLRGGTFSSPKLTGSFTIAGGTLRSPNLGITSTDAKIFGDGTLSLESMAIDGRYAMTPLKAPDATSPIDPNASQVVAVISGSLSAPKVSYDVADLTQGMKIKASEAELAILEQRKAEADARAKAQAEADAQRAAQFKADSLAILAEQSVEDAAKAAAVAQAQADKLAAAAAAKSSATPATVAAPPSSAEPSFDLPLGPPPSSAAAADQGL